MAVWWNILYKAIPRKITLSWNVKGTVILHNWSRKKVSVFSMTDELFWEISSPTLIKELDHRWLPSILVKARGQFGNSGYQWVTKHCYAKYTHIQNQQQLEWWYGNCKIKPSQVYIYIFFKYIFFKKTLIIPGMLLYLPFKHGPWFTVQVLHYKT